MLVVRGNGRVDVRALPRGEPTVLLGIALSAPLLCTVFMGTRHAYPGRKADFTAAPWADVFARTLPATYSFSTPALRPPGLRMGSTIGLSALIALLAVAAGPAVRRLTARPRRGRS